MILFVALRKVQLSGEPPLGIRTLHDDVDPRLTLQTRTPIIYASCQD